MYMKQPVLMNSLKSCSPSNREGDARHLERCRYKVLPNQYDPSQSQHFCNLLRGLSDLSIAFAECASGSLLSIPIPGVDLELAREGHDTLIFRIQGTGNCRSSQASA